MPGLRDPTEAEGREGRAGAGTGTGEARVQAGQERPEAVVRAGIQLRETGAASGT